MDGSSEREIRNAKTELRIRGVYAARERRLRTELVEGLKELKTRRLGNLRYMSKICGH